MSRGFGGSPIATHDLKRYRALASYYLLICLYVECFFDRQNSQLRYDRLEIVCGKHGPGLEIGHVCNIYKNNYYNNNILAVIINEATGLAQC